MDWFWQEFQSIRSASAQHFDSTFGAIAALGKPEAIR
jgi:hypothetical protein